MGCIVHYLPLPPRAASRTDLAHDDTCESEGGPSLSLNCSHPNSIPKRRQYLECQLVVTLLDASKDNSRYRYRPSELPVARQSLRRRRGGVEIYRSSLLVSPESLIVSHGDLHTLTLPSSKYRLLRKSSRMSPPSSPTVTPNVTVDPGTSAARYCLSLDCLM